MAQSTSGETLSNGDIPDIGDNENQTNKTSEIREGESVTEDEKTATVKEEAEELEAKKKKEAEDKQAAAEEAKAKEVKRFQNLTRKMKKIYEEYDINRQDDDAFVEMDKKVQGCITDFFKPKNNKFDQSKNSKQVSINAWDDFFVIIIYLFFSS